MIRNNTKKLLVLASLVCVLSSFTAVIHSLQPPQGYTGADGVYCINCHNTNPLNNPGGSVVVAGLPDNGYTPGTAYNFSITTTHTAADRRRWGFSIVARNSQNQTVGTFSTTNANAAINGAELSHFSAPVLAFQQSYTYNNLTWTAPQNPGPNDANITFYFVGNAANGSGSSGDFIYQGTKTISLLQTQTYTFNGNGNWGDAANWLNGIVPPATITGNATIIIDPATDGECVLNGIQHIGTGASIIVKDGKNLRLAGGLIVNN